MESASAGNYKEVLVEALSNFKCYKDTDVQTFLNSKAIDFEIKGLSTTYLLLSKEKFKSGEIFIEGYFSLTHKAVIFEESVSANRRKTISGSKTKETESFALIAQRAKRIEHTTYGEIMSSELNVNDLLNDAMGIIEKSSKYIVCRNVIIECKPVEKIKNLYEKYGFTDLQKGKNGELHTLYLKINSKVKS